MMTVEVGKVEQGGGRPLLWTECCSCDEAPMKARIKEDLPEFGFVRPSSSQDPAAGPQPGTGHIVALKQWLTTEWRFGMVFATLGGHLMVEWRMPTLVQHLASTTGEGCAAAVATSQLDASSAKGRLERIQRVSSTDGDGAVARAERHFQATNSEVMCLKLQCFVHRLATLRQNVVSLSGNLVTDLTHLVLSLRGAQRYRDVPMVIAPSRRQKASRRPGSVAKSCHDIGEQQQLVGHVLASVRTGAMSFAGMFSCPWRTGLGRTTRTWSTSSMTRVWRTRRPASCSTSRSLRRSAEAALHPLRGGIVRMQRMGRRGWGYCCRPTTSSRRSMRIGWTTSMGGPQDGKIANSLAEQQVSPLLLMPLPMPWMHHL